MAGKKGMTGPNMGGRREGAGRPRVRFTARRGDVYQAERETIGGDMRPPELWTVLSIEPGAIEFQCGDDIITLTIPE